MEKLTFNKNGQWTLSKGKVINFSDFKGKPKQDKSEDLGDRSDIRTKQRAEDNDRVKRMYDIGADKDSKKPSLSIEEQHRYVDSKGKESAAHEALASNSKIHPEIQHKLADINDADSMVHQALARNPSLRKDVQHKLADMNDANSMVHLYLSLNPSLHKDIQHKLVDRCSGVVLDNLATNPNLHPEVKAKLAWKNGKTNN